MKTIFALIALTLTTLALGKEAGAVYVKNSGRTIVHLWVNGSYQGYLKPGETRYSVSDGFITQDSGNGRDGRPVKESHGGWENEKSGSVNMTFQYPGDKKQTYAFPVEDKGEVFVGVIESDSKSTPNPPTDLEVENATAIIKGSKPNLKSSDEPIEKAQPKLAEDISSPYSEIAGDWDDNRSSGIPMVEIGGYQGTISIAGSGDVTIKDGNEVQEMRLKEGKKIWFSDPGDEFYKRFGFTYSWDKDEWRRNSGFRLSYDRGKDLFIVKVDGVVYASTAQPNTFIEPYKIDLVKLTPRR